ncbi:aldehyde dehydrogenase family protein [Streptomyces sp. SID4919]|nr:aldehyde dehydrogenase family protein [Streptomyces sp. SID4919]
MTPLDPLASRSPRLTGPDHQVVEPATGAPLATLRLAAPGDVPGATARALAAQPGWAAAPHTRRAAVLRRAGDLFAAHTDELLHVLPGGPDTGRALVADPRTPVISFTGSTAAGREVGESAGRLLKRAGRRPAAERRTVRCHPSGRNRVPPLIRHPGTASPPRSRTGHAYGRCPSDTGRGRAWIRPTAPRPASRPASPPRWTCGPRPCPAPAPDGARP